MNAPTLLVTAAAVALATVSLATVGCGGNLLPEASELDLVPASARGLRPVFAEGPLPPVSERRGLPAQEPDLVRRGLYGVHVDAFEGVAVYRFRDSASNRDRNAIADPVVYYVIAGLSDVRYGETDVALLRCGDSLHLDLSGAEPALTTTPQPGLVPAEPSRLLGELYDERFGFGETRYLDCVDTVACIRTYEAALLQRPNCIFGF